MEKKDIGYRQFLRSLGLIGLGPRATWPVRRVRKGVWLWRQTPSGALPAVRGVPIVQRVSMVRGFRKGRGCTRQGEHAHQSQCQDRSRQVGLHGCVSSSKVKEFRVEILALLPRECVAGDTTMDNEADVNSPSYESFHQPDD